MWGKEGNAQKAFCSAWNQIKINAQFVTILTATIMEKEGLRVTESGLLLSNPPAKALCLDQCFSRCGPRTISSSHTWELARNTQELQSETLGVGSPMCDVTSPPRWCWYMLKSGNRWFKHSFSLVWPLETVSEGVPQHYLSLNSSPRSAIGFLKHTPLADRPYITTTVSLTKCLASLFNI